MDEDQELVRRTLRGDRGAFEMIVRRYQQPEGDDDCLPVQVPDDKPTVVRQYELQELRAKIDAAIDKLPASQRELFVWRHINGLSYEEMAEIKGLPLGTVKNRVFQAKEMLKTLLEEQPWPA